MALRIVIVDDQKLIRAGFRALLAQDNSVEVVGEAENGMEAVDRVITLKPDLVLMDLEMPVMNGFEATARLIEVGSKCKVIALSQHDDELMVRRSVQAGVKGYLLKSVGVEELWAAIRAVCRGQSYFVAPVGDYLSTWASEKGGGHDPLASLTPRQRQVLQMIAEGRSTKEIAHLLHLSGSTVDTHRTELMRRLNLHDVASVVRFALEQRLTSLRGNGPDSLA